MGCSESQLNIIPHFQAPCALLITKTLDQTSGQLREGQHLRPLPLPSGGLEVIVVAGSPRGSR